MLLVIDSGNTNVVFAVYDGARRVAVWRCGNDPERTADEYAVWLAQLMRMRGLSLEDVTGAAMASVVPRAAANLRAFCGTYCGGPPLEVGRPGARLGMEVRIDRPEQAGADRLVNAVAGHARHGGPLIILDFGTATTFDAVDADGNYCGGVIAPGVNLSVDALYRAAARLPRIEVRPTPAVIGRATVPAMQSGVFWGYLSMVEGLVARMRAEMGAEAPVLATGGLAALFAGHTDVIRWTDPYLTLDGLVEIHRRSGG